MVSHGLLLRLILLSHQFFVLLPKVPLAWADLRISESSSQTKATAQPFFQSVKAHIEVLEKLKCHTHPAHLAHVSIPIVFQLF